MHENDGVREEVVEVEEGSCETRGKELSGM